MQRVNNNDNLILVSTDGGGVGGSKPLIPIETEINNKVIPINHNHDFLRKINIGAKSVGFISGIKGNRNPEIALFLFLEIEKETEKNKRAVTWPHFTVAL